LATCGEFRDEPVEAVMMLHEVGHEISLNQGRDCARAR
jgi:hypothetical protein